MMILPFYSLTASIVLSSFAAAFARGPVDGRGDSSEAKSEGKSHREHIVGSLAIHWNETPRQAISSRLSSSGKVINPKKERRECIRLYQRGEIVQNGIENLVINSLIS